MNTDIEYAKLVSNVIKFIETCKMSENDKDVALVDMIMEYCFKNEVPPEMMGDAIKNDVHFQSFIAQDCIDQNKDEKNW